MLCCCEILGNRIIGWFVCLKMNLVILVCGGFVCSAPFQFFSPVFFPVSMCTLLVICYLMRDSEGGV